MPCNPLVSIVIPVYNGANYLSQAIDSALAQTYDIIEILVVNDGSNDDGKTEAIAKSYGDKIRYFYKKNGGVSSALNLGINKMKGDYFSWLSHDDLYYPLKIETQIAYLDNNDNKNIIICCDSESINEQGMIIEPIVINDRYANNSTLLVLSTFLHGCSLLIPKDAFGKAGLFNDSLRNSQDVEMWMRFVTAGYEFNYLPKVMVQGRIHSNQTTLTTQGRHVKEQKDFFKWALDSLDNKFLLKFKDDILLILYKKNQPEAIRHLHKIIKKNLHYWRATIYAFKTFILLFAVSLRNLLQSSPQYIRLRNWIKNNSTNLSLK